MSLSVMPALAVYQSLWAMELRRPDGFERTPEEAFSMIAQAGFDGAALDLGASDMATARQTLPLFQRHGLGCLINAFPSTLDGLMPVLQMARDFEARCVNIIGQVMPFTVPEAAGVVRRWMDDAAAANVPIHFETHRNCITNDLYFTLQLMDAVPEMPICADLSHYVVDREFTYPLSAGDQALISRILERADSFQGRVASREQIQLQLDFPQHRKWVALFRAWWEEGFRHWRARANDDDTLIFLCELGPPEYAITGPDGYELSDRWLESLRLREWAQDIWHQTEH
ncbi:MAG: sugar phosphate isomerase/epimerase family protein [Gammaproteobacteria bacterium]